MGKNQLTGVNTTRMIRAGMSTYPILAQPLSIVQLAHGPFQFFLQLQTPTPLLLCGRGERKHPLLEDSPHVGTGLSWLDRGELSLVRGLMSSGSGIYRLHRGVRRGHGGLHGVVDGQDGMPLSQPPSHPAPGWGLDQVLVGSGTTTDEAVEQAVLETGKQGRG